MAEFMKCLLGSEQVLNRYSHMLLKKGKTTENPQVLRTCNCEVRVAKKISNWNRKGGLDFETRADNPFLLKQNLLKIILNVFFTACSCKPKPTIVGGLRFNKEVNLKPHNQNRFLLFIGSSLLVSARHCQQRGKNKRETAR